MSSDSFANLQASLGELYTIERELGRGGMATVYLAHDRKHNRPVALKVLHPELAGVVGPDRFLREIQLIARLQHPHILGLIDSGTVKLGEIQAPYYVMPFVEGESLRARLSRQGELSIPDAIGILKEVCDALAYAHARGVVHRDIKPDNVLLSGRHALVADFGVAKALAESQRPDGAKGQTAGLTSLGMALGTPAYMAPEQAAGDPQTDHRADLYALGVMAYELLAGRPPFTGTTPQRVLAAHLAETPEQLSVHRPTVSPALNLVIMKCLAKRPADRWQSAEELLSQLEPLLTPSAGVTPTGLSSVSVPAVDHWYGHPLRVGGLFILASVAVLGVVYFLTVQLGLPYWVLWSALVLLGAGLPIMLVTGLLERRRAQAHTTGIHVPTPTGVRTLFTWRRAITGGVLAFGVLAAGTIVYTAMRLLGIGPVGTLVASGKLANRDKLIVADFENRSADSTLGGSVTEAFRIDLAQSPLVTVMASSAVSQALERMKRDPHAPVDAGVARELAVREGAKAIVAGEISPVGKGFVLSAKLLAPADGAELVALRETAENDGVILPAIDRLSRRLRERIGESLRTIRGNDPLEKVTTSSLEALRLYSKGSHASDQGEFEQAASFLQQAIALDTGFAMAYRKLAVVYDNSGADRSLVIAATTKAYAHRDRLPEIERNQTVAYYFWDVDWRPDKIEAAYRAVLEVNPDEPTALNNLSLLLAQYRQWPEAELLADHATRIEQATSFYWNILRAQVPQGKLPEAHKTLDRFAQAFPESPEAWLAKAAISSAIGSYDSARSYLQAATGTHPAPFYQDAGANQLVSVSLVQGKLAEAERNLAEVQRIAEKRALPADYILAAASLGLIQATYRKDPAGGLKRMDQALKQHSLASMTPVNRPYSMLAIFYARAGQPDRARKLVAEYESAVGEPIRRGDMERFHAAGDIAFAEGKASEAIDGYRAWHDSTGCGACGTYELARAFELAKQPDSALATYERRVTEKSMFGVRTDSWTLAPTYRRLGELYEERGVKDKAADYYGRFINLWKNADPELQPQVKEIKDRLAKLVGEKP
ncbi:MAG TPA: protein kinase [Gemmatimonadales bacterium]|nr:protein kinase [Gemmatimonadales bacterium]